MKLPIRADGLWWLPEFSGKKVQGRLTFSIEEGGRLQLYDRFSDPLMAELTRVPARPYTPDLIVGTIDGRTPCTLYKNFCTDLGDRPCFASTYMFVGRQFLGVEELRFRRLSFRLRHLEEWTGLTPLNPSEPRDPFLLQLRRMESPISPPSLFEVRISNPDPAEVALTSYFNPTFGAARFSCVHVARLRVGFSARRHLTDSLQFVHDCRNFFTLLVGHDTPPFALQLYGDGSDQDIYPGQVAEVFYTGIGTHADREIYPHEMRLPMSSLTNVAEVFANWLNRANDLRVGTNWLLGPMRKGGYLEGDFLRYTQAIEALHRVVGCTHFMLSNEYRVIEEKLISAILSPIDRGLRQKLEDAIHYGNEHSFRRLLKDMIGDGMELTSMHDRSRFIERVVKTRNYLVHNDQSLARDAASGEELFRLAIDLHAIACVFLLTSVGVPRNVARLHAAMMGLS